MSRDQANPPARLRADCEALTRWLRESVYPRWTTGGRDPADGSFVESIAADGTPLDLPRRGRVTPRQIYALGRAPRFGWQGDVVSIIDSAWNAYRSRYLRFDGLFRTLVSAHGAVLDDTALLYDQAFVILACAAASEVQPSGPWENLAESLMRRIEVILRAPGGGFWNGRVPARVLLANPHMHLLEACLEWEALSREPTWTTLVNELVRLAVGRFAHGQPAQVLEAFAPDWSPQPGPAGRRVEPGHQYEWAWLLLRAETIAEGPTAALALELIDTAEARGVRDGFALNAIEVDGEVIDGNARLWAQAERLKAALAAAATTTEGRYWQMAESAATALRHFLAGVPPGLWRDERTANGRMRDTPVPASTLYHIVSAVDCLQVALRPVADAGQSLGDDTPDRGRWPESG